MFIRIEKVSDLPTLVDALNNGFAELNQWQAGIVRRLEQLEKNVALLMHQPADGEESR